LGAKRDPIGFSYFPMNATHYMASWLGSRLDAISQFWALLASGQITLRKVDGWHSLHVAPAEQNLDLAA
jgi:hypothetical protein